MYELSSKPSVGHVIRGKLRDRGEGVIGVKAGREEVRLFPGALLALQEITSNEKFDGCKIAAASSTTEPLYALAAMEALEIHPGVRMIDIFDFKQIGCSGKLSHRKTSHFKELQRESGVHFKKMVFVDGRMERERDRFVLDAYDNHV